MIDTEASELESSTGRSSFSARTPNDVIRFKSVRTFTFIVLCCPFFQNMLLTCSQAYLLSEVGLAVALPECAEQVADAFTGLGETEGRSLRRLRRAEQEQVEGVNSRAGLTSPSAATCPD